MVNVKYQVALSKDSCSSNRKTISPLLSNEVKEVLLNQKDNLYDASSLTRCKNAVCFIYCNLEESVKRGTGFFASIQIGSKQEKVIFTNNHVISNKDDARKAVARFHYEGDLPGADVRLYPDMCFYTNQVLDYTVVGCDHNTIENCFCVDPIDFEAEEEVKTDDDIFIFQHPKGETKKFSYEKVLKVERPFVYYKADTDIGSSGSVVLRDFKLIAIHSKGSDALQYNKGTLCSEILNHLNESTYTAPKPLAESANNCKRPIDNEPCVPSPVKKARTFDNLLPSEETLQNLSKDITPYWKHLGRKLKLPHLEIERIHKDHYNYDDIAEKALAMLLLWKEENPTSTVEVLSDTLKSYGKKATALKHFTF